jgi:hypothetical protein
MYLSVTVGREEHQIDPPVLLMLAIPMMPFESRLVLDHLSADGTAPVLWPQDVGATGRRRLQCRLPVTGLAVRLPAGVTWLGGPLDLQMTRRFDGLLGAEEACAGVWIGEPP